MPTVRLSRESSGVVGQVPNTGANNHFLNPAVKQYGVITLGDFLVQRVVAAFQHSMCQGMSLAEGLAIR